MNSWNLILSLTFTADLLDIESGNNGHQVPKISSWSQFLGRMADIGRQLGQLLQPLRQAQNLQAADRAPEVARNEAVGPRQGGVQAAVLQREGGDPVAQVQDDAQAVLHPRQEDDQAVSELLRQEPKREESRFAGSMNASLGNALTPPSFSLSASWSSSKTTSSRMLSRPSTAPPVPPSAPTTCQTALIAQRLYPILEKPKLYPSLDKLSELPLSFSNESCRMEVPSAPPYEGDTETEEKKATVIDMNFVEDVSNDDPLTSAEVEKKATVIDMKSAVKTNECHSIDMEEFLTASGSDDSCQLFSCSEEEMDQEPDPTPSTSRQSNDPKPGTSQEAANAGHGGDDDDGQDAEEQAEGDREEGDDQGPPDQGDHPGDEEEEGDDDDDEEDDADGEDDDDDGRSKKKKKKATSSRSRSTSRGRSRGRQTPARGRRPSRKRKRRLPYVLSEESLSSVDDEAGFPSRISPRNKKPFTGYTKF